MPKVVPSAAPSTEKEQAAAAANKAWDCHRLGFVVYCVIAEVVMIVLYALVQSYSAIARGEVQSEDEDLRQFYPFFQDVNVMIFIGFGFLMTFLHKYGFSAVGYNFVLAAFSVQLAFLSSGFWERVFENSAYGAHPGHGFDEPLEISIVAMIKALFAAAAVLISMGACLGKTTPLQLIVMATFELFFFAINETIVVGFFQAVDMGGSMVVHTFGAYFGLAVSRVISKSEVEIKPDGTKEEGEHKDERSSKTTDMTAMIGTLFLWMFWPSFNGALAPADQQQRVAINTFCALSACAVAAFAADALMRPRHKFDMVSIQNATLAGGVAIGSSADLILQPYVALLVGLIAGFLSVFGYVILQPALSKCMGLHDTCGVHNLHGMPGILGGICGAVAAAAADSTTFYSPEQIVGIFVARANCTDDAMVPCAIDASTQGAYQAAALGVTLAISIVTGVITGYIVKMPCLLPPGHEWSDCCKCGVGLKRDLWFEDSHYWAVPNEDGEEAEEADIETASPPSPVQKAADDSTANEAEATKEAAPAAAATKTGPGVEGPKAKRQK